MKMSKARFKQIIREELDALKEHAAGVDEDLLDKVVTLAEKNGDAFQAHRDGAADLETIAKESSVQVLKEIQKILLSEEQIAAVIETLAGQSSFSSNVKVAPLAGTNIAHQDGGGYEG